MDNATKAIMIGVGLFITVIIISAVLVVVNLSTGAMNNATGQMNGILDNLTGLNDMRGKEYSAAQVNAVLGRVRGETFDYPVLVLEKDAANTYATEAIAATRTAGFKFSSVATSVKRNEIAAKVAGANYAILLNGVSDDGNTAAATGNYVCSVIEDGLGVEIGLVFYEK